VVPTESNRWFVPAAALTAIFDFFPDLFPLFAPGEGASANEAGFGREVLFFDVFHGVGLMGGWRKSNGICVEMA
jgi:hypothetical protein